MTKDTNYDGTSYMTMDTGCDGTVIMTKDTDYDEINYAWQKILTSSVQLSSRCYICIRKSPYALHSVSQKFTPTSPLKQFLCSSDRRWHLQAVCPTLRLSTPLSARRSMCVWWLPASLSARSVPFTPACPGQYTHRSFQRWMSTIDTFQFGLPISLFTFCSKLIVLWGWWPVWSGCHLLRQSSGGHEWLLHLHCQTGGWDCIGCTVFMDGGRNLLDSEAPPWPVFGDCAISVHYEVLRFAVFFNEKLDLWLVCLLAILDSVFPSFLAGLSRRDAGIGLGAFPTPWFAWALSAGILVVLSPPLEPSKILPVPACISLCPPWLYGVGSGDFRRQWSMQGEGAARERRQTGRGGRQGQEAARERRQPGRGGRQGEEADRERRQTGRGGRQGGGRKRRQGEEADRERRQTRRRKEEEAGRGGRQGEEAWRGGKQREEAGRGGRERRQAGGGGRERRQGEEAGRERRQGEEAGGGGRERRQGEEAGRGGRGRRQGGRRGRERRQGEEAGRGRRQGEEAGREKRQGEEAGGGGREGEEAGRGGRQGQEAARENRGNNCYITHWA